MYGSGKGGEKKGGNRDQRRGRWKENENDSREQSNKLLGQSIEAKKRDKQKRKLSLELLGNADTFMTRNYKYTPAENIVLENTDPQNIVSFLRGFCSGFFDLDTNTALVINSAGDIYDFAEWMVVDPFVGQLIDTELVPWTAVKDISSIMGQDGQEAAQRIDSIFEQIGFRDFMSRSLLGAIGVYGLITASWNGNKFELKIPDQSGGESISIEEEYSKTQINKLIGYTNHEIGVFLVVTNLLALYLSYRIKVVQEEGAGVLQNSDSYPPLLQYYLTLSQPEIRDITVKIANYMRVYEFLQLQLPDLYDDFKSHIDEGKVVFDEIIAATGDEAGDLVVGLTEFRLRQMNRMTDELLQVSADWLEVVAVRQHQNIYERFSEQSTNILTSAWFFLKVLLSKEGFVTNPFYFSSEDYSVCEVYYNLLFKIPEKIELYGDPSIGRNQIEIRKLKEYDITKKLESFLTDYIIEVLEDNRHLELSEVIQIKNMIARERYDHPLLDQIRNKISLELASARLINRPNEWQGIKSVDDMVVSQICSLLTSRLDVTVDYRFIKRLLSNGGAEFKFILSRLQMSEEAFRDLYNHMTEKNLAFDSNDQEKIRTLEASLGLNLYVLSARLEYIPHPNFVKLFNALSASTNDPGAA